jgi:hypothetical protein
MQQLPKDVPLLILDHVSLAVPASIYIYCFLRGEMRGDGGETKTVALHISSYELRATTDYADVLDMHTGWDRESKWMSRMPGRLNDA